MSQSQTVESGARRRFGIMPKDTSRVFFKDKPLYKLLFDTFPEYHKTYKDGEVSLSLENLARHIPVSRNALYRWCNGDKMRSSNAKQIVAKSNGKLKLEDLIQHLA
jgi:hypothetical protein